MVQPIVAYGHNILRKPCREVLNYNYNLEVLIDNLWHSLKKSGGVGLAAPQINEKMNVFIVNSKLMYEQLSNEERNKIFSGDKGIEESFINAKIIEKSDQKWGDYEGCLSLPGIAENVDRSWDITVEYLDKKFNPKIVQYSGYSAKAIQHEHDHTKGILFIDHLSALSKRLLGNKLKQIINGKVKVDYPIQ
ncbi:peptide deformylase, partial [Bacteroidota bacterium]